MNWLVLHLGVEAAHQKQIFNECLESNRKAMAKFEAHGKAVVDKFNY
jgi:hypothetical protein